MTTKSSIYKHNSTSFTAGFSFLPQPSPTPSNPSDEVWGGEEYKNQEESVHRCYKNFSSTKPKASTITDNIIHYNWMQTYNTIRSQSSHLQQLCTNKVAWLGGVELILKEEKHAVRCSGRALRHIFADWNSKNIFWVKSMLTIYK